MSRSIITTILFLFIAVTLTAQQTTADKPFTLYFIGDAGKESTSGNTLDIVKHYLDQSDSSSAIVFLGDNIYPVGMPDLNSPGRKNAEDAINSQMDIVKDFKGKTIFIPGNHDWKQGRAEGPDYLQRQENYIEGYLQKGNVFLPDGGCPGPVEIPLNDQAVLIVIDTEWWLFQHDKPGSAECDIQDDADFILQLKYALLRNKNKQIIVAAHHPLYSDGIHGSKFPGIFHLFPLTELNSKLWIPMPVIGTAYILLRKNIQDVRNPRYQQLKEALTIAFKPYKNLIYVSGHEHNLEFFQKDGQYHIISGAGSKSAYVRKNGDALFAAAQNGFVQLTLHAGKESDLKFIESKGNDSTGKIVYEKKLAPAYYNTQSFSQNDSLLSVGKITVVASTGYAARNFKNFVLGKHYRKEWATPVEVEVLDITKTEDGLQPTKRGGGKQTKSLRFQNKNGQEFVLRQIDKSPDKALPPELRGTFASDIVKDQISSANPYAALAVAPLAKAAGVYHSNPKLVYIPFSKQLGDFNEEFGNTYCLFENRLVGNQSDNPDVGFSEKVVTPDKMFKKYFSDNDHRVDQQAYLNARIFDMLIGDWDRHEDQWTWASFKEGKHTIYRPVPRDRDQAFAKLDGLIPWLATRKFALRQTQDFGKTIKDVNGLMWTGRNQDRLFTTALTKEDWINCVRAMQKNLTDEVIDSSLKKMPEVIYLLSGKRITERLKSRRDHLEKYALQYYRFVNKEVEVTGTEDREFFEVTRLNNNQTNVKVYNINKEGAKGRLFFERTFNGGETKEIRLYGMGNNDVFELTGNTGKAIRIRIIGGNGKDSITDSSVVRGLAKKTKVYDTPETIVHPSAETKLYLSKDSTINSYSPRSFQYNWNGPLPYYGYNPDDGIFIGIGRTIRKQQWRKKPYGWQQTIMANYAFSTSSFNVVYKGIFKQLVGKWDLNILAAIHAPNYTFFYYGTGNETKLPGRQRSYNRIRSEQYVFSPSLTKPIGKIQQLTIGAGYKSVELEENQKRFVSDPASGISKELFKRHHYASLYVQHTIDKADNQLYPTNGIRLHSFIGYTKALNNAYPEKFLRFGSALSFYIPVNKSIVIAHRTGFETNNGTYAFYDASTLGFKTNLRGFRAMRFSGRTAFYQNTELRIRLSDVKGYIFRGKLGMFAFLDDGRVWAPGEKSGKLHIGFGGGIYFSPFNKLSLVFEYGASSETAFPCIRLGFLF